MGTATFCKQKVTMHKKWQIRVHRKQQLRVHSFSFFQKYNKFKERVNFDISFDRQKLFSGFSFCNFFRSTLLLRNDIIACPI